MSRVVLIHQNERREIDGLQLMQKCTLFKNRLALLAAPYTIHSAVTQDVFNQFVDSLEDKTLQITNTNFTGLSRLCDEFGNEDLAAKLSQFHQSPDFLDLSGIENIEVGRVISDAFLKIIQQLLLKIEAVNDHLSALEDQLKPVLLRSMDSLIIRQFPIEILSECKTQQFVLLWRGTRDGFRATTFHERCDGHSNTLIVIQDIGGYIFGGFTPIPWGGPPDWKADSSGRSFLFTLRNPAGTAPIKFPLCKPDRAIYSHPNYGPILGSNADIRVVDNCNMNANSYTNLGSSYTNRTGRGSKTVFTGASQFQVKEIDVFEIIQ
jgi:hypothetical protein